MKIFGNSFETKKNLKKVVERLMAEILELEDALMRKEDMFPFYLGQTVFEVALKDAKGRYTKTDPSFEHCDITEVEVTEKNYFKLAKRCENNEVFFSREGAEFWLGYLCDCPSEDTEDCEYAEET